MPDHTPRPVEPGTPPPGAIGAAMAMAVVTALMVLKAGGFVAIPTLAIMGTFVLAMAAVVRAALHASATGTGIATPSPDRAVLAAAEANDGWVTPAMVVRHVPNLSLDEAKATLDRLLDAGHCSMDSNDEGQLFYHFTMSGKPGHSDDLSAEEWVDQAARRLDPGGTTTSEDDPLETRSG